MTNVSIQGEFLSKRAAAEFTSLSQRTLDTARASGELPFIKYSARKILFIRKDRLAWLTAKRVDVTGGAV